MYLFKLIRHKKNVLIYAILIIILLFYSPTLSLSAVSSEEANFNISDQKTINKNTYSLDLLGSEPEDSQNTIRANIIRSDPEKNIYIIDKGLNHNVKTGMEFSLVQDNVRVANLVVIKAKEDMSALKLVKKFPEISIDKNDLVISYLSSGTGFLPYYMVDSKKLVLEKLTVEKLFRVAIQNSAQVYEAKKHMDEAWQEVKYAKAKLSPRILGGVFWDTEFEFRDLIRLTWLMDPSRNWTITKRVMLLYKYKYLVEKSKFDAVDTVLEKYINYMELNEEIDIQKTLVNKIIQEKEKISQDISASSIIINKLNSVIEYEKLKLKNLKLRKDKALEEIAIALGYPHKINLQFKDGNFPGTEVIYEALNSLVFIPENGFKVKLAKINKNISLLDYYIAKENLLPKTEFTLGYPSLIGLVLPQFPVTGKAIKESTKFLYQRQVLLLRDINLQSEYMSASKKIKIRYYSQLKDNIDIIISLAKTAINKTTGIDEISEARANYIKSINLKHKIRWKIIQDKIKLMKLGEKSLPWYEKLPMKEGLPDLKISIEEGLKNSSLLQAAILYKESVHPYLIESKRKFHKRTKYLEALLGEREALINITEDKIKEQIIKAWIDITILYQRLNNYEKLVDLAEQKLQFYKQKEISSDFNIADSKLNLSFTQLEQQKAQLEFILSLLNFKKSVNYPVDKRMCIPLKKIPSPPDYKKIEDELLSFVIFHPEAKIKEKMMKLKQKIEEVELARKGWWVKGPISVRYMDGLPEGRTFEWEGDDDEFITKHWKDGIDVEDWLGIQFPISIFDRTPIGTRIHNIRQAKVKMETQKFKNELYKEKLKMIWETRHANLDTSKQVLKETENKVWQAKKEIADVKKDLSLLKANKLDLISQERLYILRKNRYTECLNNYLKQYINVLSIGHIYKPSKTKKQKEDFVLLKEKHKYPTLKLIELKSIEIEEAYRKANKQNIFSWFFARIKRIGIGSSITFKSNVSKVRAKTRVKQMKYHRTRELFEADRKFARLHSILHSLNLSREKVQEEKQRLTSLLNYLEKEAEVSLATKQQVNELKDILDSIELKLLTYNQSYGEYSDEIKQVLGLPYYVTVTLPERYTFNSIEKLHLDDPEKIILQSMYTDPELLFQISEVELTQKEKKLTRAYRDLSFSLFGELGIVGASLGGLGLEFWLFDSTLKPEKYRFVEREKRFKLKVTKQVQSIRKEIYTNFSDIQYYFSLIKYQADILNIISKDLKDSLAFYKEHKIRWDGEYGLKPVMIKRIKALTKYLNYLTHYQTSLATLLEYIKEYSSEFDEASLLSTQKINLQEYTSPNNLFLDSSHQNYNETNQKNVSEQANFSTSKVNYLNSINDITCPKKKNITITAYFA